MSTGKRWLAGAMALCLGFGGAVRAGEEAAEYGESLEPQRIVVTASRIPTPVEAVPETVTVFAAESTAGGSSEGSVRGSALGGVGLMEARQYRGVADVLRATPGVSVLAYGTPGSLQSVRLRGMDSNHTGFFMDGMPMDDPLGTGRRSDMSMYTLDNIGQVEVLRGPQSALYGSNAMAGAVNLTSKKGEGPFSGFVSSEAGSHGTVQTRVGAQAGSERGDFSFGGSFLHTDGWSVADKANGNREKDGYDRGNVNMRLGYNFGDNLRLDLFANAAKANVKMDDELWSPSGYISTDVKDLWQKSERFMIRPQATLSLFDGRWVQKAGFGYIKNDRKYKSANYPYGDNLYKNRYEGATTKFDYQSVFQTHENNAVLAGVDVITESGRYTPVHYGALKERGMDIESSTTVAAYVEDRFSWNERLFLNAGLRYERHDDFGSKVTWKSGAMYVLPTRTKLKASAGTGFSTPTVYALHIGYPGAYPTLPNADLKPEKSLNWDVGFEQSFLNDRIAFGSSFFWNKVEDKIHYADIGSYTYQYVNLQEYRTRGFESFLRISLCDKVILSAHHTWLRSKQKQAPSARYGVMPFRPRNEVDVNVDWLFHEKGVLTAGVHFVGNRMDDTKTPNKRMPSYSVARVAASWKATDNLEVFGRVENVFNKKYQEYYGYGAERIGFYAGMTMSF